MTITIGGKPVNAKPVVQRVGKHRQLSMDQIKKRHPADPFPPISEFEAEAVDHRISVGCELKMWAEQELEELVPVADEENWLRLKLRDPDLQDSPHRPGALKKLRGLQDQVAEIASDIAYLEAHADRIWQSLESEDRDPLALRWVASVADDRIVLNAWTRIAQVGFTWPDYYRVNLQWFEHLGPVLIQDMKDRWPEGGIVLGKEHEWETPE